MDASQKLIDANERQWWLIDPIGGLSPFRAARTPAMNVDATAPIPGVRTPSLPVAGIMFLEVMKTNHKGYLTRSCVY